MLRQYNAPRPVTSTISTLSDSHECQNADCQINGCVCICICLCMCVCVRHESRYPSRHSRYMCVVQRSEYSCTALPSMPVAYHNPTGWCIPYPVQQNWAFLMQMNNQCNCLYYQFNTFMVFGCIVINIIGNAALLCQNVLCCLGML